MLLKDKVVIVTGGFGLLGKEFIKCIVREGGIGNSIQFVIDNIKQKYGKIDALVNNAYPRNKNYGRRFECVEYEDFCENINLHLGG